MPLYCSTESVVARTGIYFSDVKKARDQLVAQGRRPSIDAIRAALGDTGSKTTIHKLMRELDAEEGAKGRPVSEAILALAGQIADQLKLEADGEVVTIRAQMGDMRAEHEASQAQLAQQLADVRKASDALAKELATSQAAGGDLQKQLHAEQIARHTAEQRAADLEGRVADAERHQASLEDKHRHARDALEHYRTASKEQREQDTRRHEQQVQAVQAELRQAQLAFAVKQEDLTRLNKEAAALANELGANKQVLYLEKEAGRKLARKADLVPALDARVAVLETQLKESRARADEAEAAAERAAALCSELRQEKTALETALAGTRSTADLEERLAKLDQAVFGAKDAPPPRRKR
jgi:chromosome segregation ATPase